MKHDPATVTSTEKKSPRPLTSGALFLKSTLLAIAIAIGMLIITALLLLAVAYSKFRTFLSVADITQAEFQSFVKAGLNEELPTKDQVTTILVLGLDTVANKSEAPPLTDSMLLIGINHTTGAVNTVALPRDLWSEAYKTKINALYVYGQDKYPQTPEQFPKEVIEELTGIPIHFTVVVSLDMVAELVDTLGGVSIDVPHSFVDSEFPRDDVDIATATDSAQLYETVTFEKGPQLMSGRQVLQYIRSRHSQGDTGTDIDRTQRQQLVISSIANQVKSKKVLLDPVIMGTLYRWYEKNFQASLGETTVVAFSKSLFPHRNNVQVQSHVLTIYPDDPQGLIEHPPVSQTDNQWVYSIKDAALFKDTLYDMLISP